MLTHIEFGDNFKKIKDLCSFHGKLKRQSNIKFHTAFWVGKRQRTGIGKKRTIFELSLEKAQMKTASELEEVYFKNPLSRAIENQKPKPLRNLFDKIRQILFYFYKTNSIEVRT